MESRRRRIARLCSGSFFCAVWSLFAACGDDPGSGSNSAQPAAQPREVLAVPVEELAAEQTVRATGSLAAQDRAVLSAKVSGRVEAMLTDMGSAVKEGQLLARIEKRDYELRRQQAEAALAQARARLGLALSGEEDEANPENTSIAKEARALLGEATKNRDRVLRLSKEGVIPDAEVETAEAAFHVAESRYDEAIHEARNRIATLKLRQAELALADQQVQDTEIRAPFPGIVEQRQTSPGEFLNVGAPVLTIVRVDPIRARLEVAEKDAPRLLVGQKLRLVEGSEQDHTGKVSRVSPVIASGALMLVVEADLSNPTGTLRPGSYVKADIIVTAKSGLFIPRNAVVTFAGIHKIFSVQEGKVVEKEVRLSRELGEQVEVIGPVKAGDLVVVQPGNLRNGEAVVLMTNES